MKFALFLIIITISNLSYSYENNQLLLHNKPKKIEEIKLVNIEGEIVEIIKKTQNKKIYLLNFWATWCPPCIKEIPELLELKEKNEKKIEILFISVDSNPKKAIPKFLKKHKFKNMSIFSDKTLKLSKKLNVKIMPTTILVNNDLNEISRVEGYIDWLDEKIYDKFRELL